MSLTGYMAASVLVAALATAACPAKKNTGGTVAAAGVGRSSSERKAEPGKLDLSNPRTFFLHLYKLAQAGEVSRWAAQLSRKRRARGRAYATTHLNAWGPAIVNFFGKQLDGEASRLRATLRKSRWRLSLVAWSVNAPQRALKMTVAKEGGRLVIDEN